MGLSDYLVPCLSAFAACLGFCIIFNIRAPGMVICSIGGGLSWLVYLLVGPLTGYSDLLQSFWAAVFLSAYSEGMARVRKCPVTGYLLVAFLPLVPGGGIYSTHPGGGRSPGGGHPDGVLPGPDVLRPAPPPAVQPVR